MEPEAIKIGHEPFIPLEYRGTELPRFSRNESTLREIPVTIEELFRDAELKTAFESLKNVQGSRALRGIDLIVDDFVCRLLDKERVDGGMQTRAKSAVRRREWAGVKPQSGEHFAFRELIAKANRLKFALVAKWISESPDTGLTDVAKAEYLTLGPAMAALDRLYLKVVTEPSPIDTDERTRRGLKDEGSVVRIVDGEVAEVPMHKAYSEETKVIVASYRKLLAELARQASSLSQAGKKLDPDSLLARKIRYYQAVLKAYETSATEDWLAADTLLPQQIVDVGDVMHIHSIEVAYLEDRHVRAPEISLRAPDAEAERTQQLSTETKTRMLRMMDDPSFADIPTMRQSKALVGKSNAAARHFLGGGMDMDHKPAGQVLPNELETRLAGGVDASLDVSTVRNRQPLTSAAFVKVFGQDAFAEHYEPRIDAEQHLGGFVASHEMAHAIGLAPDIKERLGKDFVNPYVEEWKATAGGLVFNNWLPYTKGELPLDNLRTEIVHQLANSSRYSAIRDKDSMKAYYRQSIMLMKVAEETGIVQPGEEEEPTWKINLDENAVRGFFERVTEQYHDLLGIYAEGSRDELGEFVNKNLQPTEFVNYMALAVENPGSEALPAPAEAVKSPTETS